MLINNRRPSGEGHGEPDFQVKLNWLFVILAAMVIFGLAIWASIDWRS
ncbi:MULTISPECIES: hypothetical protein [Nesterenkonia]|uniref:Uncharacterized protein n=1 Tax=Nesterenkonia xinjiangensis TaxID=225327 RepID=A0A7Z0K8D5_9MICC|nr:MULTISPECIES: hypothetical protein [Nesterenkonia]MDZ5078954.1 hypothetical protein [Nesterenkonia sp. HG001]NYJ77494.1 hypothetical protein [Nesterenkonia xinjiangensis]